VFPRLLALAERAWHLPKWSVPYNYNGAIYSQETNHFTADMEKSRDDNWRLFANILGQKEFTKLELMGIDYRLPTVGAVIEKGMLNANVAFPGLTIEYQLQGSGDAQSWQKYQSPVKVDGAVVVRSRSLNGLRTGRITKVPMQ
jgi:hexosaminidase